MKGLVSIVTPSFNSSLYIVRTIQSVLNQTYKNWEMIIVDDYSLDNSVEVITKYVNEYKQIKLVQFESNKGAAEARNAAISMANGEFIAFLDSDDLWKPEKLVRQIQFMGEKVDFSFTAYALIDQNDTNLNKTVDMSHSGSFGYKDMLKKKATLGCSTVVLRRNAFQDLNMPLIRTGQDYGLWLKLLKTGKQAYLLNEVCSYYRILPNSISRNKFKKAKRQWQIYRELESLPIGQATLYFCFYAWRAIFRK